MKVLRIVLLLTLGSITLVMHDLIAALAEHILKPPHHDMLGFGNYVRYTGLAFIMALPLCIGLGGLWFNGNKKYIPHILLLVALGIWSANAWSIHPMRTSLFVACAFLTLPLRWLIDRTMLPTAEA